MAAEFEVRGDKSEAPFTLTVRRGEGLALLSMDWKKGKPPEDFVGFAIECKPPGEDDFFALQNLLSFDDADGDDSDGMSTRLAPIQKFRWVHFPRDAEVDGDFQYRVTPVFMGDDDELSYGDAQSAAIALGGETYPDQLNVTFTRGFVSSQAFVRRYEKYGKVSTLIPGKAAEGLEFKPKHPKADEALNWMGFEARRAIIEVLDQAIDDEDAEVRAVVYDLNEPEIVSRFERLGKRLKVIIDDSAEHGESHSAESKAAKDLEKSAGTENVKRQHMGALQHNKTIAVDGPKVKAVVCGSTNLTWRGFFVQANNALILRGDGPTQAFMKAFDDYWDNSSANGFGDTPSADLVDLGLTGIDSSVAFSPHAPDNALLEKIGEDIGKAGSSVLYSLAFLSLTEGSVSDAIEKVTNDEDVFVYGISDSKAGIDLQKPDGNVAPVFSAALSENVPEPFKSEPSGGLGNRMHHKFVVIDFDKPTARVYLGSYNFSPRADTENGENLVLVKDRRVAVSYAIEALRIFDHYHFRVVAKAAKDADEPLVLAKPPRKPGEKPWWDKYYTEPQKVRDREVFA
jgi:hypothetical protein